jgi:hypothetical protein
VRPGLQCSSTAVQLRNCLGISIESLSFQNNQRNLTLSLDRRVRSVRNQLGINMLSFNERKRNRLTRRIEQFSTENTEVS